MNLTHVIARLFGRSSPRKNSPGKAKSDCGDDNPNKTDLDPFPDQRHPFLDPLDPFPVPVRLELTDVFDLHSIPPRDVKRVVIEYLSEARRLGFKSVRIIHGKGIGIQREAVRKILSETPFVSSFGDAPPEAGGWGATIAHLSLR
jgi:hypothetical protein